MDMANNSSSEGRQTGRGQYVNTVAESLPVAFAHLQGRLLTKDKVEPAVAFLAEAVKEATPGTIGAGISLIDQDGSAISTGTTDAIAGELDAAQYRCGEGPCLTSWATSRVIRIDDLATEQRWPLWRKAVSALPVRSSLSVPLVHGDSTIGAIKVYSLNPGAFSDATEKVLVMMAVPAATLPANVQGPEAGYQINESLKGALRARTDTAIAVGMLMERYKFSEEQAMQYLLRAARTEETSFADVVARVLDGELLHGTGGQ